MLKWVFSVYTYLTDLVTGNGSFGLRIYFGVGRSGKNSLATNQSIHSSPVTDISSVIFGELIEILTSDFSVFINLL